MDNSNGYEGIAARFISGRGQDLNGIGASQVQEWSRTLEAGSMVLDLGCGTGIPISKILVNQGFTVYGLDASPTMTEAFLRNFPYMPVACEPVQDSTFFQRKFDGIVAWGLIFLLSEEAQALTIQKAAKALKPGGKFLFTAPFRKAAWKDVMTHQYSRSLGAAKYRELLLSSGLQVVREFKDAGDNYYYDAVKTETLLP
ncbi:class I SAM-dependent methyltransferase [Rufibacter glacialis]|uniref:Class I SAM-dependent methyltransferase n=1 Tax=Rufibacter glacialis TaxID=1259555 RepID=A0A5M8QT85_9BACT|nr:class I SAM-dependent methyltransferase [Rufibacter glacialis]KAA6438074.1 class I SAM-dependent methyltransferase [Rufibacter glacialis]GGK88315.1 putative methyltransferase [Rufibacter glacialis]